MCSTTYTEKKSQITFDMEDLVLPKQTSITRMKDTTTTQKAIVRDIWEAIDIKREISTFKDFHTLYDKLSRVYKFHCKKNLLYHTYNAMVQSNEIEESSMVRKMLQTRPSRNLSGVTVITVLTSPYPNGQKFSCRHNCYYCPAEPGQPRSYLKKEPAVARANQNHFDPILQTTSRLKALLVNGHEIDKVEFILEGGTYTEYPPEYLERFHRDLVYCVNTYFDSEKRKPLGIEEEIALNADAPIKIVGVCIETRPDTLIDEQGVSWLPRFRKWGVTRVQLGVQHTDNNILRKVNRGHTLQHSIKAIQYLQNNGFKVDIHLMPDLPNSNPEKDRIMFKQVFQSSIKDVYPIAPDQIKIYPCSVVPWTVIEKQHRDGKYTPYAETNPDVLIQVLKEALLMCPPWIRLPRVVRDIPNTYISGGNHTTNLRQIIEQSIEKDGGTLMEMRARECGRHPEYSVEDAELVVRSFYTRDFDQEFFLSFESLDRRCLFGFLRLRIRNPETTFTQSEFTEIEGKCAMIRELHVYGTVAPVGSGKGSSQHRGIGGKLVKKAIEIAETNQCDKVSVIQGMGVVRYYETHGFKLQEHFMTYDLTQKRYNLFCIEIIFYIFALVNILLIMYLWHQLN